MSRVLKFHYVTVWAEISKISKKHVTYKGIIKENGISKKKRTKIYFYSRLLQNIFVITTDTCRIN